MTKTYAIGYRENLPISDPNSLTAELIDVPALGPHDLLVEVQAVSVNPVDMKLRQGAPADGFKVLGFDAAGIVREIGPAVTLFQPGDEVYYAGSIDRPGTNQKLQLVDERIVGHKPKSLSFADAASLPLTAITAWETLFDRLELTRDTSGFLLVEGATGGVGSILLQLAEQLLPGVKVIATASSPDKADWVRGLGAEFVVDHKGDLAAQVLEIVPGGVDWVFTAHSEGQMETYAEIVKPFGTVVAIDDGLRDVSPLKWKSIGWLWELMFSRPVHQTPDMIEQHNLLDKVAEMVDNGQIRPTTTKVLTPINPENLRHAHQLIESNRTVGKIVLHAWEN